MQCWLPRKANSSILGVAYIEFVVSFTTLLFLAFTAFATVDWVQKNEAMSRSIDTVLQETHTVPFTLGGTTNPTVEIDHLELEKNIREMVEELYNRLNNNFLDIIQSQIFIYGSIRVAHIDPISGTFLGYDLNQHIYTIGTPSKSYIHIVDRSFNEKVKESGVSPVAVPLPMNQGIHKFFQYAGLIALYASVDISKAPASYISELNQRSTILEDVKVTELRGGVL